MPKTPEFKRKPRAKGLDEKTARLFHDLYRGGPDGVRGDAKACYWHMHPKVKEKTAESGGSRYLNDPLVQAKLQESAERVGAKADVTQERVLTEIGRIAFFDARKLLDADGRPLPIDKLDDDTAAAIAGVKVRRVLDEGKDGEVATITEYKIADKNSSLEKLMRYLGAYEKDNKQKGMLAELPRETLQLIADRLRNGQ